MKSRGPVALQPPIWSKAVAVQAGDAADGLSMSWKFLIMSMTAENE